MTLPTPEQSHVLHHAHSPPTVPGDMYDEIFEHGRLGDWHWAIIIEPDGSEHRVIWMLVPSLRGGGQGPLEARGLELIQVFPRHAPNNWAKPGPVNGWDGNEDLPTLNPSIFVGGNSPNPGWHGFFRRGKVSNA